MSEERYQIEGKIGRGGIGEVYRAYDDQLGRPVAIKRMLPPEESDLITEDSSANLLKEAKVLSTLNHPNIVTVFDVGADAKGVFVVMELLDGETLDETISRGVLTLPDFQETVIQTLEAMIAAQDVGLVHRDLKPGNVMVVWLPSGKFQLKVLDFGLAKFSERPSVQTSDQGDAIMGSIFFMAPEQFERGELDFRTDMYSLGCIYYHCLTGKYPFQGDTAAQVMASHLQNKMVPLERYRPDLPAWATNWVTWLLQRKMGARPEDAKTALEHFMNESVGLPELQRNINQAETAGVSVVAPGSKTTGVQVVVAPKAAAAPALIATAAPAGPTMAPGQAAGTAVVAAGSHSTSSVGPVKPAVTLPPPSSGKGKWIAIGISALLILGVGVYVLFNRMAKTKAENEFLDIVNEETPFGDAQTVRKLLKNIDPKFPEDRRQAAARALSAMQGDGIDEEVVAQLDNFQGKELAALIKVLTVRAHEPAVEKMVLLAASSPSVDVQKAALNGVTIMGGPQHLEGLLSVLKNAKDEKVVAAVSKAIVALARSVENDKLRTKALLENLQTAAGEYRKNLVMVLGMLGGDEVLAKFKDVLDRGAPEFQYEVLASLMNWPDASAAILLQKLAEETEDDAVRLAAARAYIRLIGIPAPRTPGEEAEMLDIALSLADAKREKARIFPILAGIPQDWASDYAGRFLDDPDFKAIAKRTQDTIRQKVGEIAPLESGQPLVAKDAKIGGSYEATYSEQSDCITNWRDPTTWISWNFIVEEPGSYSLVLSQANDEVADSTYEVIVGENAIPGKVRDTRDWTRFVDISLGDVNLPEAGIYTLTVKPKGTAKTFIMNLRSATLTKN